MLDKSSDLSWESLLWQQANVSPIFPPEELVNYDKLFRIDTLTHTCYSFAQHRIFPRHFEKHLFFFFQRRTIYMETILYVLSTYIFMSLFHFILPTLYYQCVHFHIIFTFDLFFNWCPFFYPCDSYPSWYQEGQKWLSHLKYSNMPVLSYFHRKCAQKNFIKISGMDYA